MNREELETYLADKGFRPVAKVETAAGDILIAEGSHDLPEFHIRTLWLLSREGPLWGRWVNHRLYEVVGGVYRRVTAEDRLKAAVEDAMEHLAAYRTEEVVN